MQHIIRKGYSRTRTKVANLLALTDFHLSLSLPYLKPNLRSASLARKARSHLKHIVCAIRLGET